MAINDIEQTYDTLPYTSQSFKESNPQKLEAIARLISLNPIPASNARVLEIGCSFGGNLIPFALNNKNADVVGIDLSGMQISKGQKDNRRYRYLKFKAISKRHLRSKG